MAVPIFKEASRVQALKALLRLFSYLFHFVLGLFLLGVAGLAIASEPRALQLGMLPWTGAALAYVLLFGALLGLISVVLAITGRARLLFFLWSLVVAVMLLRGYFFTGYRFASGGLQTGLELLAAAWLALVGAWFAVRQPRPERYR
jgi:hypothetical protein